MLLGLTIVFIAVFAYYSLAQNRKIMDKETRESGILRHTHIRKRLSDDDWRYIASRYSVVTTLFSPTANGKDLSKENERVRWIKSLNPNLTVLVYGSAINAANFPLKTYKKPREHDDWFLRDENGKFMADWEYKNALHLDPGNKKWQEYVGRTLSNYIQHYGYDGVFMDLVKATTRYVNYKKTNKAVNPKTGKVYTDAEWHQANLNLLKTIRQYIADKQMIINGARGRGYFSTGYSDFFRYADGICIEGFCGWFQKSLTAFGTEEAWKADIDVLVDCVDRGKTVHVVTPVNRQIPTATAQEYEQLYLYLFTSFLLGMGKSQFFEIKSKILGHKGGFDRQDEISPSFYNVSLGEPHGNYYKDQGVYQRNFEKGKILVNPSRGKNSVTLQGVYYTNENELVHFPFVMTAHTGAILLVKGKE